jgi:exosortase/archaeosortase family protein
LAILILATKNISLKKSIKIFFLGFIIILIANVLRIRLLFYILINYSSNLFDTLHLLFWKIISGIFVFLIWILLAKHYKIKAIPVYSDIKELSRHIKF